jgi:pimeloyl-ACP methyl ester carboxylesterase
MGEAAIDPRLALPPRRLTRTESLLTGAGARLDRFVFERYLRRAAFPTPRDGDALRARLVRARAFYGDPLLVDEPARFYAVPSPAGANVRRRALLPDGDLLDVRFTTGFTPAFPEARAGDVPTVDPTPAVARWWRHREPGHPAMICIHGYAGGHLWLETLAFDARRFYRAGVDVVIYVLPYHGPRTPRGAKRSGEPFFDVDLVRTNEAFAQAIYELRALLRWLRAEGTGPVGAFGMSLGGYTTALLASVEPELAFAVPMIPLTSLADMMWSQGDGDPRLARAIEHGWSLAALQEFFAVHAPLARAPVVAHDRRLIIAALADRICPPAHADALWRHWGQPRIHWYPGGHLAQFRRGVALREVRTLLRDGGLLPRR